MLKSPKIMASSKKVKISWTIILLFLIVCAGTIIYFGYGQCKKTWLLQPKEISQSTKTADSEKTASKYNGEYPNTNIYFEHNDEIWKLNPQTGEKEKIAVGNGLSLSSDKNKLVYICSSVYKPSKPCEYGIHMIDLANNLDTIIVPDNSEEARANIDNWSNDDNHIILDQGTSPVREKIIIENASGKELASFTSCAFSPIWLDNEKVVYTAMYDNNQPWARTDSTSGISIFDINKNQKTDLLMPTDTEEYELLDVLDDKKIYYSVTSVNYKEDWQDENKISTSYWTIDQNGENRKQIDKIDSLNEEVEKIIKSLNIKYTFISNAQLLKKDSNWLIFNLYNEDDNNVGKTKIYILNVNDVNSLKELEDGINIQW